MRRFLKRLSLKNRLLAPLYTSFLLLVILVVAQGCLSIWIDFLYQQAFNSITHSLLVERETALLLSGALDEQTNLRGYLLTGDKSLLVPYKRAQTIFHNSFNRLYTLVEDNPEQLDQLNELKTIYERWQSNFAQKVIAGTASRTKLPGKTLFDPMRIIVQTLLQHEDIVLEKHQQRLQKLTQMKSAVDLLSIVAIAAGVGWNLWLLRQRVEVPLRQLTQVGQAWRAGKMEVRLDYSSPDEIGRLAGILDAMASEIRDRQQRSTLRNQQLEDLISALSHDLRTPLLATRATVRSMQSGAFGAVNDTWQEVFQEYRQANEELLKLVENLLDVSRYEAGGTENLSCETLNWEKIFVQATNQISAISQRQCALNLKIPQSLPTVYGDQLEIQRVVQNLLDNAVRVSEPDLHITLEVAALGVDKIQVAVHDNGPGIATQDKERLFHRFIQGRGRRGKAGLGLYLCRQIIEAHGGTINVESTLGEGSTFWFTLPIRAQCQPQKE